MPLFGYLCEDCETLSEVLIRGSEEPCCPSCGSARLVKQASAFAPVSAGVGGGADAPAAGCGMADCCQMRDSCGLN
jgi:putative FmdB family regulatory protein